MRESRERRRWRGAIAIAAVVVVAVIVGACSNPTNEPETYTVSFDRQGGTGGSTSVTVTLGQPMPTALAPTKAEAVFYGYYTDPNGAGAGFYTAAMESSRDWDVPADTSLFAYWIEIGGVGPAGGIVFYDKGEYSDGWRFLEAAPASTEWTDKPWGGWGDGGSGDATVVGAAAQGTGIGAGAANTEAIVAEYGETEPSVDARTDYAAKLAADLVHGGYDDWFLPSRDELKLMYQNLHIAGSGSFHSVSPSSIYWSSSETNANYSWTRNFSGDTQINNYKWNPRRVRAARAF